MEVCKLIVARAAEFNHVNVSTALCTVLQRRRDGVPRQRVEQALHALEAPALRMIDAFEAREVTNALHIMAKTHYRPWDPSLVLAKERRGRWWARSTHRTWQTRCGRVRRWGVGPGRV